MKIKRPIFETRTLEGKPGEWKYEIVDASNLSNYESITPEDVKEVQLKVVSGPSNVGYVFQLGDIVDHQGEDVYIDHPLVQQVIDYLSETEDEYEPYLPDDDADIDYSSDGDLRVLFIGDSQTYYPGVSYAELLLDRGDIEGKNVSRNGAPLEEMQRNLKRSLQYERYDIVTIMGGGNNSGLKYPPYKLYDNMYSYASAKGAKVIAITNPTKKNLSSARRKKYPSNESLASHVRFNSRPDAVIDANLLYSDSKFFNNDMVHLNKNAHKLLSREWLDAVSSMYPSSLMTESQIRNLIKTVLQGG